MWVEISDKSKGPLSKIKSIFSSSKGRVASLGVFVLALALITGSVFNNPNIPTPKYLENAASIESLANKKIFSEIEFKDTPFLFDIAVSSVLDSERMEEGVMNTHEEKNTSKGELSLGSRD